MVNDTFFNEFTLKLTRPAAAVVDALAEAGVLGGVPLSRLFPDDPACRDLLVVAATEMNSDGDIAQFAGALQEALS